MQRVKSVRAAEEAKLFVIFRNGVEKVYDVRGLCAALPQFRVLEQDANLFARVKVDAGGYGISWNDELDLSAEELWENGEDTGNKVHLDVADELAESLYRMRKMCGMTQAELAKKTGIDQGDISKIERGLANPSLSTLKRLADGMGGELSIEFKLSANDTYFKCFE